MVKRENEACCTLAGGDSIFRVESLISVDERGQMVLPKDVRGKANIRAGDKLALISWEKEGKICCLTLIKAEEFAQMVKGFLGPIFKGIIATEK